jgi:hypothetical protein
MATKTKKTTSVTRTKVEQLARGAGKIAARAERAAKGAVDKAVSTSSAVADLITHPTQIVGAIGGAVSTGQEKIGEIADTATGLVQVGAQTVRSGEIVDIVGDAVEERLKAVLKGLGLPSREDYARLLARVEKLERETTSQAPKSPARKRAAAAKEKAAPAKAPSRSAVAKVAAAKTTARPRRRSSAT